MVYMSIQMKFKQQPGNGTVVTIIADDKTQNASFELQFTMNPDGTEVRLLANAGEPHRNGAEMV